MNLVYNIKKILIYIKAARFKKSVDRKLYRKEKLNSLWENELKSKIWGVSYSLYDGEELLESSLKSIRKSVDYINVVYQNTSWFGKKTTKNLKSLLENLQAQGLIDEIIFFEPNLKLSPYQNEKNKRNLGLKYAKKYGCNYFMTMDTDEFYQEKELEAAKIKIIQYEIDYSYCSLVNYGLLPTERILTPMEPAIAFFSKINFFSKLGKNKKVICCADPTRQFQFITGKQYFLSMVTMHHMTYVRKDINQKFNSSSNQVLHNNLSQYMEELKNKDIISVKNNFHICID